VAHFVAYLLTTENALIMAAVSVSIHTVQLFTPQLEHNSTWGRLLPALPVLLCSAAVWFPGLVDGGIGQRVLLGIVLGAVSGQSYKVLRQSILGDDRRIRHRPEAL
jgi:hypothetical protein